MNDALPTGISVVVPVYRSESMLAELVERLGAVLAGTGRPFELILVCDASPDDSWGVIQRLARERAWIRGKHLMRNYGQHNALLCGVRDARFDLTVTMDDDLQHPPEEIPALLAGIVDGVDVVYGTPRERAHGAMRALASRVTKLVLQSAMGAKTAASVSAFRTFRTGLRQAFSAYRGPWVNLDVLLTWGTTRFAATEVRQEPRRAGESNYTFRTLVTHAFNMMTGFSTLPLQFASLVGFFFTLFGLGVLAFVLVRYLIQGGVVQGFAFLASTIAIFSGAQLFALGIIGEYLARMHFRMMDRPPYTVRAETPNP